LSNPTVEDALRRLADNILSGTDVARSFVWPFDSQSLTLGQLPVAVTMRRLAVEQPWGWWAFGVSTRHFQAEIFILLEKGTIQTFDEKSARLELMQFGWAAAIADVLAADLTLGGAAEYVGNGEQGPTGRLFDYAMEHIQFRNDVYWGIRFVVPVVQRYVHEVVA
jgi:hypothetical protein